jgi:hypothetical protein
MADIYPSSPVNPIANEIKHVLETHTGMEMYDIILEFPAYVEDRDSHNYTLPLKKPFICVSTGMPSSASTFLGNQYGNDNAADQFGILLSLSGTLDIRAKNEATVISIFNKLQDIIVIDKVLFERKGIMDIEMNGGTDGSFMELPGIYAAAISLSIKYYKAFEKRNI